MSDADGATFVRVRMADAPAGVVAYWLMRCSLAARMIADSEGSGDVVEDVGAAAFPMLGQAVQSGTFERGEALLVGVALGGEWLRWSIPAPVEPVPGSPGQAATRN